MNLILTRNPQGWYTISHQPLVRARVRGTRHYGLYLQPGEPMDLEYICPEAAKALFGVTLERWQMVRVEVKTRTIGPVVTVEEESAEGGEWQSGSPPTPKNPQ